VSADGGRVATTDVITYFSLSLVMSSRTWPGVCASIPHNIGFGSTNLKFRNIQNSWYWRLPMPVPILIRLEYLLPNANTHNTADSKQNTRITSFLKYCKSCADGAN
jgi:hypothetical protein